MGERRLVLHVGSLKTGSTSIQALLAENRAALRAQGLLPLRAAGSPNATQLPAYAAPPLPDRRGTLQAAFHQQLGIATVAELEAFRARLRDALAQEVAAAGPEIGTFFLSNENLFRSQQAELQALRDLFAGLFDRVTVVAYLRRQDHYAVSKYTTDLRRGEPWGLSDTFEQSADLQYLRYDEVLQRWAASFGRDAVIPRIFAAGDLAGGDVVRDFCALAGIRLEEGIVLPERRNVALSARAQAFLRQFNEAYPREKGPATLRINGMIYQTLAEAYPGPAQRPTRAEAERLLRAYRKSNEALRRDWFPERAAVFSEDLSGYPETPEPPPEPISGVEIAAVAFERWERLQREERLQRSEERRQRSEERRKGPAGGRGRAQRRRQG